MEALPPKVKLTPQWHALFQEYFNKKFPDVANGKRGAIGKASRQMDLRTRKIEELYKGYNQIDRVTLVRVCDFIGLPPEIYLKELDTTLPKQKRVKPWKPKKVLFQPKIVIQNKKILPFEELNPTITPPQEKEAIVIPKQVASQRLPLQYFELASVPTLLKKLIPLMEALPPKVKLTPQWHALFQEYFNKKFPDVANGKRGAIGKASRQMDLRPRKIEELYKGYNQIDRVTLVRVCDFIGLPPEIYLKELDTTLPKQKPIQHRLEMTPKQGKDIPLKTIDQLATTAPKEMAPSPPRTETIDPSQTDLKKHDTRIRGELTPPKESPKSNPARKQENNPLVDIVIKNPKTPYLMAVALDRKGKARSFEDFINILQKEDSIEGFLQKIQDAAKLGGYQMQLLVNDNPNMELIIQMGCYIAQKNGKDHNTFPGFRVVKKGSSPWEITKSENFFGSNLSQDFITFLNAIVKQRLRTPFQVDLD